jgi:glycosyltransferase involved in cell wall biosynthesis
LKVAIIIPKLAEKGPVIVAKNIALGLKEFQNIEVDFYYFEDGDLNLEFKKSRLDFFKAHDFSEYDVIHSHMLKADLYCVWHNLMKKHRVLTTLHQFIYNNLKADYSLLKALILNTLWKYVLKNFHGIVYLTNTMCEYYNFQFKSPKCKVIPNGVNFIEHNDRTTHDLEVTARINSFKKRRLDVIGTLCLLTHRKGVDQIIRYLQRDVSKALVIIGDGKSFNILKKMSLELGVDNRVYFAGFLNNGMQYLSYFDFFFMGSRSEGFGLSLVEAAYYKVPIICSRINTFTELFLENEVSFFDVDDNDSLENAIRKIEKPNRDKLEKLHNKVLETYSICRMSNDYLSFYREMLK